MKHTFYTDEQKEESKNIIQDLINDFALRKEELTSKEYKEDSIRKDFIDKFFTALGWDMYNDKKHHENMREVTHEDRLKIKGKTKAPDYGFNIGKATKFYVEAKAPHIDLDHDKAPAHQVRLYGYNRKLPISILTDFEEFAIYDTKYPPKNGDNADIARLKYYKFNQYVEKFDEIWSWCSRDALYDKDSQYHKQEKKKIKKGEKSVDDNFLEFLTNCRTSLAKNIANLNKDEHFDAIQFNHIVQIIVDRIIFLRIAEDRAIEEYGMLEALTKQKDIYENLKTLFKRFEKKYNSTLFKKEDIIVSKIKISDSTIKKIIKGFYYPNPYEFSVMPVEILGSIYEQFLGSIIRVLPNGGVKIEEKPEVRKAGGVYYTPQYIVDYIVENTIGELVKNKTPDDVSKLKILDPACGSGSFLIGAYEYLLDWHLRYYTKNKKNLTKATKEVLIYEVIFKNDNSNQIDVIYKLTANEKKRILLNNIHGVDIDAQAVEVTKLSLNLKMLEDENYETKDSLFNKIGIAALPDLSEDNIKCGNSLISSDYYSFIFDKEKKIKSNLEKAENKNDKKKIKQLNNELIELQDINNDPNPFDWEAEGNYNKKNKTWQGRGFPDIMKNGGFDVIIGNPPYVRIQNLNEYARNQVIYYNNKFDNYVNGSYDLYIIFLYIGYSLLNQKGKLGYILPHKFFQGDNGQLIRKYISKKKCISEIVDFGTNQIFENATTYTCLIFLNKNIIKKFYYKKFYLGDETNSLFKINSVLIKSSQLEKNMWNFHEESIENIINKIEAKPLNFKKITYKIFKGSSTGNDDIFLLRKTNQNKQLYSCYSKFLEKEIQIEKGLLKEFVNGLDVRRYYTKSTNIFLLFPYVIINQKSKLVPLNEIRNNYPKTYSYLSDCKQQLLKRKILLKNNDFYKFSAARSLVEYNKAKIMIPDMLVENRISYDSTGFIFHGPAIHSVVFNKQLSKYHEFYFLGILNSKTFWFYIKNTSTALRGDAFRLTPEFLNPFCFPNVNNKTHDNLVYLVNNMIELQKKYNNDNLTTSQSDNYKKIIDNIDKEINKIVYELYNLTEKEISIVENRD